MQLDVSNPGIANISLEVSKRRWRWLERQYASRTLAEKYGRAPDIGADIRHDRSRLQERAEQRRGVRFERATQRRQVFVVGGDLVSGVTDGDFSAPFAECSHDETAVSLLSV